jgi:hypothetical protein
VVFNRKEETMLFLPPRKKRNVISCIVFLVAPFVFQKGTVTKETRPTKKTGDSFD